MELPDGFTAMKKSACLASVVLLTVVAGCGGGSRPRVANTPTSSIAQSTVPIDGRTAFSTLSERITHDVNGGRSKFNWKIDRDGFHIQGNGEYTVQSPDNLHLETHYRGEGDTPAKFKEANDSELLILGQRIYLNTPFLSDGWVLFTPQEFVSEWDVAQRLIAQRSPVNLQTVVAGAAGDVTDAGADTIDGRTYTHLSTTVDAGSLMNALADAYGSQGQVMFANRFSGPIPTDVWLDPVTLLPRRLTAEGSFMFMASSSRLSLTIEFLEPDNSSRFASAPQNATPLQELR